MAFALAAYDAAAIAIAYYLGLLLRFDFPYAKIPVYYLDVYKRFIPFYIVFCLLLFWMLRLYRSIWRFASFNELSRILIASVISCVVHIFGIRFFLGDDMPVARMPVSYYVIGAVLQLFLLLAIRFAYRFWVMMSARRMVQAERIRDVIRNRGAADADRSAEKNFGAYGSTAVRASAARPFRIPRVMLVGAGDAGRLILRDIQTSGGVRERVVCIIDDDKNTWRRFLDGVEIVGGREMIPEAAKKYQVDKIYVAIPSATMQQRKEILEICAQTDCEIKNLPGVFQLVTGDVTVSHMREVSVEDLLGREPVEADLKEVFDLINGKTVLVTGGAGSIGSELCRQIAGHHPKKLIILDIYENSAYELQLELEEKFPDLDFDVLIASVRDSRKMFQVFEEYRPQIVYHAAAHKHVPLMETVPCEVIKNNAIGTYKTAFAAMVHGCERFVLISTDKAVNPTNIMGASKRLCEMVIQSFDAKIKAGQAAAIPQLFTHEMDTCYSVLSEEQLKTIKTEFVAVRFGNVLGSNGSVIPIFKEQIKKGGPVTVTHPEIIRYFMTIPEAVSLVLLAGTYAKGGEIFVLDMGSPVKIDTLARNLIRMSGFKPDVDIKIEYTGLRPGEKLYEEKLMAEEGLRKTDNDLIYIGNPIPFDVDEFLKQLWGLMDSAYNNRRDIRERVKEVVKTYHPEDGG